MKAVQVPWGILFCTVGLCCSSPLQHDVAKHSFQAELSRRQCFDEVSCTTTGLQFHFHSKPLQHDLGKHQSHKKSTSLGDEAVLRFSYAEQHISSGIALRRV